MASAGICASDAHFVWGTAKLNEWPGHDVPAVLGHEGAGIVESVGSDVSTLKPGDHVLTTFMPSCRKCPYCISPLTNFCATENLMALGAIPNKKLTKDGRNLIGLGGLGIYSQYSVLKLSQVVKVSCFYSFYVKYFCYKFIFIYRLILQLIWLTVLLFLVQLQLDIT